MKLLRVSIKVKVYSAILSSRLVDENVVEVVSQPLHTYYAQRWDFMVDDVLPAYLSLNHIRSNDVHDVVSDVEQFDEVVKLLLNQLLDGFRKLLSNVLVEY